MPSQEGRVLIAGGGIGGLAASIALARRGIASNVLERSAFEEETGAGIQLGPNATRALRQIGALDAVEQAAFRPKAIWMFDGVSGRRLASVPLGNHAEARYGAPYLTLHRADLHAALLTVAGQLDEITLTPRFEVAAIAEDEVAVAAQSADRSRVSGSCLIGADGLWSVVRKRVAPNAALRFAGATASRTLVSRKCPPSPFDAPVIGLWLGPGAHLVHYPVRRGGELNVVAVTEGGRECQGWNEAADAGALHASFSGWCKDSKSLLECAGVWRSWSLHRLAAFTPWSAGRAALLGDVPIRCCRSSRKARGLPSRTQLISLRTSQARRTIRQSPSPDTRKSGSTGLGAFSAKRACSAGFTICAGPRASPATSFSVGGARARCSRASTGSTAKA